MGCWARGVGCWVWNVRCRVLGCWVWNVRCRVYTKEFLILDAVGCGWAVGCRVRGVWYRVWGVGCRAQKWESTVTAAITTST